MLFFHEQCLHSSRCATAYTYTNGYLRFMPAAHILLRGLPARGSLQAPAGLDWALLELPGDLLRLRQAHIGRLCSISKVPTHFSHHDENQNYTSGVALVRRTDISKVQHHSCQNLDRHCDQKALLSGGMPRQRPAFPRHHFVRLPCHPWFLCAL